MSRLSSSERLEAAVAGIVGGALGGALGIMLGLALAATLAGCDSPRVLGVSSVQITPLPDSLEKWTPATLDDNGEPVIGACPTCGPVLWLHPSGHVGFTAVEVEVWTPPPTGGVGVYRPQAIQAPNVNLATRLTQGVAVGDSVVLELSGLNRVEVRPFYGVSADTLDTLTVVGAHAALERVRPELFEGYAFVDVVLPTGQAARLWTFARLAREP